MIEDRYSIEYHADGRVLVVPYFSRDLNVDSGGFTWKEIQEHMQEECLARSLSASNEALAWTTMTEEEYFGT